MGIVGSFYMQFLGHKRSVECWSLKEAIVGMCGQLVGACKCMKKQVVRPVE
jgi:hypothetical protein